MAYPADVGKLDHSVAALGEQACLQRFSRQDQLPWHKVHASNGQDSAQTPDEMVNAFLFRRPNCPKVESYSSYIILWMNDNQNK